MKSLRPNWFFEDLPDFEYKKYVLLAYLQDVHAQFTETRLYPALSDLVFHYRNLTSFVEQKQAIYNSFPERLTEIDMKNLRMAFSKVMSNDDLMNHLEEVVSYSIPELKKHLDEGKEIYDFIEKEINLSPVGILPIYRNEGYMLVRDGDIPEIKVYEFSVKFFQHDEENFRSVQTQYLTSYKKSFVNTSENIKIDMIRSRKKLPNPATFSVESVFEFPLEETIIPLAKRMLMKYIETV
ncbi:hypothetical protein AEM51_12005 [Bacteroidetes bacterium UKL13-3]|jgi:hypothetical protein|nr:hypothetical protein AEM51_12005 [Bacteroidetes bacterium UKL13-3]HCP92938.1 hypothetical protein [Bacteroidota bacterium]